MNHLLFLLFATLPFFFSCSQTEKKEAQPESLRSGMHDLASTLSNLLPYIIDREAFHQDKNREVIEKNTQHLSELSHQMNQHNFLKFHDPGLEFMSNAFDTEIKRAYNGLKLGHREYARNILSTVSGFCIRCHTRNQTGPQFLALGLGTEVKSLPPIPRGELYAATRQFDLALSTFKQVILDQKLLRERPFDWERAVRYAMSISVRYRENPVETLKIIELILSQPNIPLFLRKDAEGWKKNVKSWIKEKPARLTTAEAKIKRAESLLEEAKRLQSYPTDRAGDLLYLRASDLVHQALSESKSKERAHLYYLVALCYEALRDLGYWTLHEHYYKACIESSAHSVIAETCFARYQESIYSGYSGSSGTSIPPEVSKELRRLELLSEKR